MEFIPEHQGEYKLSEKLKKILFSDGIQLAISRFFQFFIKKKKHHLGLKIFKFYL